MRFLVRAIGGVLVGGWAMLALAGECWAQASPQGPWVNAPGTVSAPQSTAGGWKAKRTGAAATATQATEPMLWPAPVQRTATAAGSIPRLAQQTPPAAPSAPEQIPRPAAPEAPAAPHSGLDAFDDLNPGQPAMQPMPQDDPMQPGMAPGYGYGPMPGYPGGSAMQGTCFDECGDACTACGGQCAGACWGPGAYWGRPLFYGLLRDLSLFGGVHGFKGPVDGGQNGNFGIHEGLNWSSPLGDPWGCGFQVGFQAVHSNFQGYSRRIEVGDIPLDVPPRGVQTASFILPDGDRDQVFLTAGLFRRATMGGIQWGLAFDLMHDAYYYTADLKQIRGEISAVWPGWREIGFWGAFSVGNERIQETFTFRYQGIPVDVPVNLDYTLEPTDQFNFFYRQYFRNGGEGRLWLGFTSNTDFLFGGDLWIPLSTHFAVENSFNVLVPKETGEAKQREQSWSVMMQLVWYPGRTARASRNNPFRPVLGVADNSVFMVDKRSN